MKSILKLSILLFFLTGCQDVKRPEPPENLLSKEKVVEILTDAYLSNATRSKGVLNRIRRAKGLQLDSMLYSKHEVDSLSFAVSNAYYASNLEVYTEIITEVEKLLTLKKAAMDSANAKAAKMLKTTKDTLEHTTFKAPEEGVLTDPVQEEE